MCEKPAGEQTPSVVRGASGRPSSVSLAHRGPCSPLGMAVGRWSGDPFPFCQDAQRASQAFGGGGGGPLPLMLRGSSPCLCPRCVQRTVTRVGRGRDKVQNEKQ